MGWCVEISYVEFTYIEAGLYKTMLKLTLRLGSPLMPLLEIKNNEAIRGIPLYILPLVALAQITTPRVCNSSKTYVPAAETLDRELEREVHRHHTKSLNDSVDAVLAAARKPGFYGYYQEFYSTVESSSPCGSLLFQITTPTKPAAGF